MSLNLANFFEKKGYLENYQNYQISSLDYTVARNALLSDNNAFFFNGMVSLASSINSLNKSNYSWAFIQSYYSLFYLARAFNGINNYGLVYIKGKPFGINIQPSEKFIKLKGNSHDVVFKQFKKHFANDILLKTSIEELSPIDWFNNKRNHINYTLNPFTDPNPPISLFKYNSDIRNWIVNYTNDSSHTYTFDPKHCFIAYPIQLFNRLFSYYTNNGLTNPYINDENIIFFKNNISDNKGPITSFIARIIEMKPD